MSKRCVGEKHDKNIVGRCFPAITVHVNHLVRGGLSPAFLISPGWYCCYWSQNHTLSSQDLGQRTEVRGVARLESEVRTGSTRRYGEHARS